MDGWERERCILYNNSFFRRLLLPREKKKRERRERERERRKREEKRKEKQESEKRLVRMRTAKHFLRASAWLHVRERPDAFDFSAETFFLVFFFLVFLCVFSTFALCFLFYCRNDVNDDDDTDAENQFHPRFADKNNTVILYWSILRASG